jgi:hypothetical protein
MDSIMSTSVISEKDIYFVNTTSSYILWNDKGSFTWERLPTLAQSSPIRKVIIRDLNGDGKQDVILSGNDYSYDVSTGYYDSNKGLVLLGQGNRKFELLTSSQSGLLLNGQVNSLLYFDGPNPFIVGGINRDSVVVIANKPGVKLP